MSCPCYRGLIKLEQASSGTVTAAPCSYHNDNEGYYKTDLTHVAAGSGHDDRVYGKRTTTYRFANGTYWQSSDLSTDISIDSGASCPSEVTDTNYDAGFDYGAALDPPTTDVFENEVLGSALLSYANAHADYGGWSPLATANATLSYLSAEDVVTAQQVDATLELGDTQDSINAGPSTVASATVAKYKFRASLAGPELPVKVVYDFWNDTDSAAHSTDNEFTLNDSNTSQQIEIPLVADKEIRLKNVRLFFCPFHL